MIPLQPAEFTQLTPEEIAAIEAELRKEDRDRMGVIPWAFAAWTVLCIIGGFAALNGWFA